jgi:hypothetical protein
MEKASEIQWGILFQIFNLNLPFSFSLTCSRLQVLKQRFFFFTFLSFTWHSLKHTVLTCVKYVKLLWYEKNITHTSPHT